MSGRSTTLRRASMSAAGAAAFTAHALAAKRSAGTIAGAATFAGVGARVIYHAGAMHAAGAATMVGGGGVVPVAPAFNILYGAKRVRVLEGQGAF